MNTEAERREAVREAAEMLDTQVGKFDWLTADWRSKIDVDAIDMISTYKCILGQLGGYIRGVNDLSTSVGSTEWYKHDAAFASCTREWKEYLRGSEAPKWAVDTTIWGKTDKREYRVMSYFEDLGVKRVTIKDVKDGAFYSHTVDFVEDGWQLEDPNKPKYEKGDLLKGDKGTILIVGDFLDGFLQAARVSGDGSYADLDYYLNRMGTGEKFTLVRNISTSLEMAGLIN